MEHDTLTLRLSGTVTLSELARAMSSFYQLIDSLTAEVGENAPIEWILEEAESGSFVATMRGRIAEKQYKGDREKPIANVIQGVVQVGRSLRDGVPIPFSQPVKKAAFELTSLINGHVKSLRFETEDEDAEISRPVTDILEQSPAGTSPPKIAGESLGVVRGRIQSMSNRNGLRFTIYASGNDRAVSCYLAEGSEEIMREAWGKQAIVEGIIRRDPHTGLPTSVREVSSVNIIPEQPAMSYRIAIGSAPARPGSISPEKAVRRVRDG